MTDPKDPAVAPRPQRPPLPRAALVPLALFLAALALRLSWIAATWNEGFYFSKYFFLGQRLQRVGWIPGVAFDSSPLYVYLIGVLNAVLGLQEGGVRILQALATSITVCIVWEAGKMLGGRVVGAVAALILAVYPTLILYDTEPMSECWVILANASALVLLLKLQTGGRKGHAIWAGLFLGMSALLRPNIFLWLPFVALGFFSGESTLRAAAPLRSGFRILAAFVLAITPIALINTRADGRLVLVTASFGSTFYGGSNPYSDGLGFVSPPLHTATQYALFDHKSHEPITAEHLSFRFIASWIVGRKISAAEASQFWTREALSFIRQHPGKYLGLLRNKARYFFHSFELHDTYSSTVRGLSQKGLAAVAFNILWIPGVIGFGLSRPHWRRHLLLYGLFFTYFASCLLFYLNSRMRLPAVMPLALFAGLGVQALGAAWREKKYLRLGIAVAGSGILAAFFSWPTAEVRAKEAGMQAYVSFESGTKALQRGDLARAVDLFDKSIAISPGRVPLVAQLLAPHLKEPSVGAFLQKILSPREGAAGADPSYRAFTSKMWSGYSFFVRRQYREADAAYSEAIAMDPDAYQPYYRRGLCRMELHLWQEALHDLQIAFDKGQKFEPELHALYYALGLSARNAGENDLAEEYLQKALFVKPDYDEARQLISAPPRSAAPRPAAAATRDR